MKKFLSIFFIAALALVSCSEKEEVEGTLQTPEITSLTVAEKTVSVKWGAVEGATSYIVYYNVKDDLKFNTSEPIPGQEYDFEGEYGKTYEVKVKAASNTAASAFSEIREITLPEPETPTADAPVVSNVRAGLGWVNFTMAKFDKTCDYIVFDGGDALSARAELISTNADGSMEYSIGGLELNKTYSNLSISRTMAGHENSSKAAFAEFKTGSIAVMTGHPSPCHLAFEWDDVAANANWTFSTATAIDPLTRTYKIELAKDAEFKDVVFSFYTVNNYNTAGGAYHNNNWVGQSGTGTAAAKPYANANTNAVFGQLEPATTYWFRVRTAAGESVKNYVAGEGELVMNAPVGKSAWSSAVSAATEAAHTAVAGELLYQGFDDHAVQMDHVINAAGIVPVGIEKTDYAYPHKGEFGLLAPHTGLRYDELGASATAAFPGNGETKFDNLAVYEMTTDKIPSMKGWWCAKACYPQQGALKLGGSAGQYNYIITPAFTNVAADTQVTISCDAGAAHAASTVAKLHVKIYRAATKTLELAKTFDLKASAFVNDPAGAGYHNKVEFEKCSVDAVLQPGDYVMFSAQTIKSPATNRLVIDNILIVKK